MYHTQFHLKWNIIVLISTKKSKSELEKKKKKIKPQAIQGKKNCKFPDKNWWIYEKELQKSETWIQHVDNCSGINGI